MRATAPNRFNKLVLSLFPGADLFGRAFEAAGFCVVRGPELLLGQHVEDFHVPAGGFEGVIGGPPCQMYSCATNIGTGTRAVDCIPDFVRLVGEAAPVWSVMENVIGAEESEDIPASWAPFRLRDWPCGGLTMRRRTFWFSPPEFAFAWRAPEPRPGRAQRSLLATDGRSGKKGGHPSAGHPGISTADAAALQGYPELAQDWPPRGWVPRRLAVKYLGNGVPRAMGDWIARVVSSWRGAELAKVEAQQAPAPAGVS